MIIAFHFYRGLVRIHSKNKDASLKPLKQNKMIRASHFSDTDEKLEVDGGDEKGVGLKAEMTLLNGCTVIIITTLVPIIIAL